jgi:hypothetical protein
LGLVFRTGPSGQKRQTVDKQFAIRAVFPGKDDELKRF